MLAAASGRPVTFPELGDRLFLSRVGSAERRSGVSCPRQGLHVGATHDFIRRRDRTTNHRAWPPDKRDGRAGSATLSVVIARDFRMRELNRDNTVLVGYGLSKSLGSGVRAIAELQTGERPGTQQQHGGQPGAECRGAIPILPRGSRPGESRSGVCHYRLCPEPNTVWERFDCLRSRRAGHRSGNRVPHGRHYMATLRSANLTIGGDTLL